MRLGPGSTRRREVGPLVNRSALDKVTRVRRDREGEEGATLIIGGEVASDKELARRILLPADDLQRRQARDAHRAGGDLRPRTSASSRSTRSRRRSEVANGIKYGLSSSIYTRDVNRAFRAIRDFDTGITYINAGTIGAEVQLPFGGDEGDRQRPPRGGPGRLEVYTEWKSVYVDYSGKLQRAQIDLDRARCCALSPSSRRR